MMGGEQVVEGVVVNVASKWHDHPVPAMGVTLGAFPVPMAVAVPFAQFVCRQCGCALGDGLWMQIVGNGKGGSYMSGPFCKTCAALD